MAGYWQKRADLRMTQTHEELEANIASILKGYDEALIEIDSNIKRLMFKGKLESYDLDELLSVKTTKEEVDRLYRLLANAKKTENIRRLKEELAKLAYKARITRQALIQANIEASMAKLTQKVEAQMSTGLSGAAETMYNRSIFDLQQQIGYAFPFTKPDNPMIQEIMNENWSGKHWSKRLWGDNKILGENLSRTLSNGMSQGKSYYLMSQELKEVTRSGKYAAVRLVRTEASFVANQAKLTALTNSGVEEFEYVAVLDARTSEVCQDNDGRIVKAEDAVFGKNLPPLHPNCRSTFVAELPDDVKKNLTRQSLNPVTGEKEKVSRNMTYEEWKENLYDTYGKATVDAAIDKELKRKKT